jgi:uncharacterized repeat protein (TIGR01451 family)
LGLPFVFSTPVASAQVISRLKDRKASEKAEPQLPAATPSYSAGEASGHGVPVDRARLRPIPLGSASAEQAPKGPLKTAVATSRVEQISAIASIPHISVETSGPAEVNLGRRAKYAITVRNEGDQPTRNLNLQVSIPVGAEVVESDPKAEETSGQLEYPLGELAPRTARRIQLELIARQHGAMELKTSVSLASTSHIAVRVRSPEVAVKFHGPSDAILGDTVMFKATVTNTGDGTAEDLSIVQLLPAPTPEGEIAQAQALLEHVQSRIERLAPGQSEEVLLPAVATSVGMMRANIVVKASDGLEMRAEAQVRVRQPSIEMKTVGPDSRAVQRTGGYVILVANTGDIAAGGIVVTASIPKGLEVVGIEKRTNFDKRMGTLTWNLPKIDAGATESLKFQVKALEEGEHQVQVMAIGEHKLSAESSHVIRVAGKADLTLSVEDTPGPIEVGGRATYEVRVKNTGTKNVQNVRVRCAVPNGLEIESSPDFRLSGTNLEFTAIETLAVGEERLLTFTASGREAGDQIIRFTMLCDTVSREITADTSTFFFKADK